MRDTFSTLSLSLLSLKSVMLDLHIFASTDVYRCKTIMVIKNCLLSVSIATITNDNIPSSSAMKSGSIVLYTVPHPDLANSNSKLSFSGSFPPPVFFVFCFPRPSVSRLSPLSIFNFFIPPLSLLPLFTYTIYIYT